MNQPKPEFAELKEAMESVQRFAEAWAAAITENFKPLTQAAARMQRGRCGRPGHCNNCGDVLRHPNDKNCRNCFASDTDET